MFPFYYKLYESYEFNKLNSQNISWHDISWLV